MNFFIILSRNSSIVSYIKIQAENKDMAILTLSKTQHRELANKMLSAEDYFEYTMGEYTECIVVYSDIPKEFIVTIETNGNIIKHLCNSDQLLPFGKSNNQVLVTIEKNELF